MQPSSRLIAPDASIRTDWSPSQRATRINRSANDGTCDDVQLRPCPGLEVGPEEAKGSGVPQCLDMPRRLDRTVVEE